MKRKLTDLSVSRIAPPATGRLEVWDQVLPAFGIRISSTGRRTWMVATRRPGSSHPVRIKLGAVADLSLADARAKAREMMEGGAPAAPVAFKEMVEAFLEHGRTKKGRPLRQNTADQYRRNLARYAAPLHKRPVAEITRREVADLLRTVATKSGSATASLVRSMITRLFGWAIEVGYIDVSPASGTPSYAVPKRSRVLSDAEIRALWTAGPDGTEFTLIVRLLLWTGTRRGEAGGIAWPELSRFQDGTLNWTIPGSRTKNGRELALPLPQQAVAALADWPRFVGRDHLFGRRSPHGFNGWQRAKTRLDAVLRFNRDWDLHDIRRTVETRMAGLGIPKDHVNKVLNHAAGPVTEAYDMHDYLPEKRNALATWAREIERIVSGTSAKVIALR
jgi:integrase